MSTQLRISLYSLLAANTVTANLYEVPLVNDLAHQRYNISITVGTPAQSFNLLFDTGATDVWVPEANSSGCAPNCPMAFDPTTSSTIVNTTIPYEAIYGLTPDPANSVIGFHYNDTISVAGLPALTNAPFAVGNVPTSLFTQGNWGIFGMGSPLQESVVNGRNRSEPYTPLWERLALASPSGKKKFGVWLNAQNASTGSVQFGGVDISKYTGRLENVPIDLEFGEFTGWSVNLTSVTRVFENGIHENKTHLTAANYSQVFTIDTGSPNIYLPTPLYTSIISGLNATEVVNGAPYVPCSLRSASSGFLDFGFPTTKSREIVIKVPLSEIVYPPGYPVTVPVVPDHDSQKLCYFGMVPSDGPVRLLGATFIRSAYLVFDKEDMVVSMARAKWSV